MDITFLGTGTSHGVPMIGCDCRVCKSTDAKNKRTRTSALIHIDGLNILIDTTPELRLQCLANDVRRVDSVVYTHAHADHIFGLDDIRRFNQLQGGSIACYGSAATVANIRQAFEYIFVPTQVGGGKPKIDLIEVNDRFHIRGVDITPIPVMHGNVGVLGYRIGNTAYVTDCSYIPDTSMALLEGLDTLILGVLRKEPHETHFTLEQGMQMVETLSPGRAFFVHMSHGLDHEETNDALPERIRLAYDGLKIHCS